MDEIKAALSEKLGSKVAFEIPLFGGIPVPQSALVTWVIIALLTVFAIWLTHGLQKKPGRRQMVAELMVGFINNFCKGTLGEKHWRTFAPYLGSIGLYLVVSNLSGLVGVDPPTKDLNVTAGLAVMSAVLIYGAQFRYRYRRRHWHRYCHREILGSHRPSAGAGWTDQQEPDFRLRSGRSHRNLWSAGGHPADFHELIGGVAR